jgi:hypothetical protein
VRTDSANGVVRPKCESGFFLKRVTWAHLSFRITFTIQLFDDLCLGVRSPYHRAKMICYFYRMRTGLGVAFGKLPQKLVEQVLPLQRLSTI